MTSSATEAHRRRGAVRRPAMARPGRAQEVSSRPLPALIALGVSALRAEEGNRSSEERGVGQREKQRFPLCLSSCGVWPASLYARWRCEASGARRVRPGMQTCTRV